MKRSILISIVLLSLFAFGIARANSIVSTVGDVSKPNSAGNKQVEILINYLSSDKAPYSVKITDSGKDIPATLMPTLGNPLIYWALFQTKESGTHNYQVSLLDQSGNIIASTTTSIDLAITTDNPAWKPTDENHPTLDMPDTFRLSLPNFTHFSSLWDLFGTIIQILLLFAGAIGVVAIIIGGYQYITAGGNPESSQKAKNTITWAIIGLIIIFSSYIIVDFVIKHLT